MTWKNKKIGLIKPFFQASLVAVSIYISATRFSDYKHFMSDIIAGMLLGILSGTGFFYTLTDFLKKTQETDE